MFNKNSEKGELELYVGKLTCTVLRRERGGNPSDLAGVINVCKILTKEDIRFDNNNFWWYYISTFRGFDDDKELNLDEALEDVVDIRKYVPGFNEWYEAFFPEEDILEHPNILSGKLTDTMQFAIEFHCSEIDYYLNNYYIGNLGGHFKAWFLTLNELLAFDKYTALFLLLLPMLGIEEHQRAQAEKLVSIQLKQICMFAEQSDYIAECIVNGLIIKGVYIDIPNIGINCSQNHSVRNIGKYPQYNEDVIQLNKSLFEFLRVK